jgi:hypothetical protein
VSSPPIVPVFRLPRTDRCLLPTFTRLAVLTALAAVVLTTARAEQPPGFELLPRGKQGETFRPDMTLKQTREADGKVTRTGSGRTPVDVEVVVARRDGYVVRWKPGETAPDDSKPAEHPLAKAMLCLTDGMTVDREIDADGELLGSGTGRNSRRPGGRSRGRCWGSSGGRNCRRRPST